MKFLKNFFLILVLLCGFGAVGAAQGDYRRAALWEKEITAFAESDKMDFPKTGGVLFVGSSSIRGWRSVGEDYPQFPIVNRGFGGSHLEDVNFYAARIVFPYKPKLIVLYAGENDLAARKSVETVFDDYKKFVRLIHENLPKTRLIFVSLKPSPARWSFTPKFKELNDLIKAETEKDKRALFVDVWTPMLGADGESKRDIFLGDRLHMNSAGYEIWRETLFPYIKQGFKGSFR